MNAAPKLALISNPLSYTNSRSRPDLLEQMEIQIEQVGGWSAQVYDDESLCDAVKVALAEGCKLIIANGGDGTIQGVASELQRQQRSDVAMAVLPGGRTNVIAADLGMRGATDALLHALLQRWHNGQLQLEKRAILRLAQDETPDRFGFLVNGAGIANLIEACWAFRERYRRWGMFGGFGTGFYVAMRLISGLLGARVFPIHQARCYWNHDGEAQLWSDHLAAFSLTTNEVLPLGVSPYAEPGSEQALKGFKATVINGEATAVAWRMVLGAVAKGLGLSHARGVITGLPQQVIIAADQELPYHLDGEAYRLPAGHRLTISRAEDLQLVSFK